MLLRNIFQVCQSVPNGILCQETGTNWVETAMYTNIKIYWLKLFSPFLLVGPKMTYGWGMSYKVWGKISLGICSKGLTVMSSNFQFIPINAVGYDFNKHSKYLQKSIGVFYFYELLTEEITILNFPIMDHLPSTPVRMVSDRLGKSIISNLWFSLASDCSMQNWCLGCFLNNKCKRLYA